MENTKVTRSWGVAAAIVAAAVCIAAAALTLTTMAKAQQPAACCPAVVIQWLPQPVLEAKFREKVLKDNQGILSGLQRFAKYPDMTTADMSIYVEKTYLANPRLWVEKKGWVETWDKILPELKNIIHSDSSLAITSVTVLIEYLPYTGADKPETDTDAIARVRMTFSASPDGHVLEGTLKHSRVCEIS
jgi:hypothetical protein